jgi:hypothetical protein
MAETLRQYYTRVVHKAIRNLVTINQTPVDDAKMAIHQYINGLPKDSYSKDDIEMKHEAVTTFTLP